MQHRCLAHLVNRIGAQISQSECLDNCLKLASRLASSINNNRVFRSKRNHYITAHGVEFDTIMTRFTLHDDPEMDALFKYIIIAGLLYSMVENKWFRRYCFMFKPKAEIISRSYVSVSSVILQSCKKQSRKS